MELRLTALGIGAFLLVTWLFGRDYCLMIPRRRADFGTEAERHAATDPPFRAPPETQHR